MGREYVIPRLVRVGIVDDLDPDRDGAGLTSCSAGALTAAVRDQTRTRTCFYSHSGTARLCVKHHFGGLVNLDLLA